MAKNKFLSLSKLIEYTDLFTQSMDNKDASVLQNAKTYTDTSVAQKSQVQIITWEADD